MLHFLHIAIELVDLVRELQDVSDWITFGLYLGVKMPKLNVIKLDCQTVDDCRREMLDVWQKTFTPTWSAVVQALIGVGMRRLALEIAQKHGRLDRDSSLMVVSIAFAIPCLRNSCSQAAG